jgi:hypothetical protein
VLVRRKTKQIRPTFTTFFFSKIDIDTPFLKSIIYKKVSNPQSAGTKKKVNSATTYVKFDKV